MALTGDTVRFKARFKSHDNLLVTPINVSLTIYNERREVLKRIKLDDTNEELEGVYFYDFILPDDEQELIFEFRGLHDDMPILARGKVKTKFY